MLALPGSSYLYQGEELGLHEVADLPPHRAAGPDLGADAERQEGPRRLPGAAALVTATATRTASASRTPGCRSRPASRGPPSPPRNSGPDSTLELYRDALRTRRALQTDEELEWIPTDQPDVLHFVRPGGWHCVSNFGEGPVALPDGVVRVSSVPHEPGVLPGESTVWFTEWPA